MTDANSGKAIVKAINDRFWSGTIKYAIVIPIVEDNKVIIATIWWLFVEWITTLLELCSVFNIITSINESINVKLNAIELSVQIL